MSDEQHENPSDELHSSTGRTTNDLSQEAQEARRMYEAQQRQTEMPAAVDVPQNALQVRFDVRDFPTPLIATITQEITIGRADTVANYTPEVDLTAYGAYRLGISRRHAIVRRLDSGLHIIDLGSRNGTSLNNTRLEPNSLTLLHDGDEISFGNLVMRVSFYK